MTGDHYQALGVLPDASPEQVREAYLRLMRAHHPDRRPGDPVAEEAARRANAAWEVLRDPGRRATYDRLRTRREATSTPRGTYVVEQDPSADVTFVRPRPHPAYSAERQRLRQEFHRACLKVGVVTVTLGLVVLLALQ